MSATGSVLLNGKNSTVQFSCDMSDTAKRFLIIDGVDRTSDMTFSTYTDEAFGWDDVTRIGIAADHASTSAFSWTGVMGEVVFTNEYVDLGSVNNFIDVNGRCAYGGEDGAGFTGTQPLVYCRMLAGDPGINLGSLGNFSVNSGPPFLGARGGSEYWARSVTNEAGVAANQHTNYMTNTGLAASTIFEYTIIAFCVNRDSSLSSDVYWWAIGPTDTTATSLRGGAAENAELMHAGTLHGSVTDGWIPQDRWFESKVTWDSTSDSHVFIH